MARHAIIISCTRSVIVMPRCGVSEWDNEYVNIEQEVPWESLFKL